MSIILLSLLCNSKPKGGFGNFSHDKQRRAIFSSVCPCLASGRSKLNKIATVLGKRRPYGQTLAPAHGPSEKNHLGRSVRKAAEEVRHKLRSSPLWRGLCPSGTWAEAGTGCRITTGPLTSESSEIRADDATWHKRRDVTTGMSESRLPLTQMGRR